MIRWANNVDSTGLAGPKTGAGIGAIGAVLTSESVTSCGTDTKLAPCFAASAS